MKRMIIISCIMVMLLAFTGCGKITITDDEAVDLIENEFATLIKYDEESNPIITAIHEGFQVEIISIDTKSEQKSIICNISNYNVSETIESMEQLQSEMTVNEFAEMFYEAFPSTSRMETEVQLVLNFDKDNSAFSVQFTEKQLDQAMGGMISYYNNQIEVDE